MSGFQLTLAELSQGQRSFAFTRPSVLIGRALDCDLVLDDRAISRRHARIFLEKGCYFVEDLGSSNGTRVNGAPVRRARLHRGDALALGSRLLEFSSPQSAGGFHLRRASWALAGFGALGLAVLWYAFLGRTGADQQVRSEPLVLSATPIKRPFGYGNGVEFGLELNAPGRVLVVLHFQSKDIQADEVRVSANGAEVGALPADVLNPNFVSHELIIRPELLKSGRNKISFENTRYPAGKGTWRIWNLWVETHLLPELPPEQLEREAWLAYRRAEENLARQDVAPSNRYLAWKDFRSSWIALEAIPEMKPSLYGLAREGLEEARRELDRICSQLLLQIQRHTQVKNWRAVQESMEEVRAYFPSNDHPCPSRAERMSP